MHGAIIHAKIRASSPRKNLAHLQRKTRTVPRKSYANKLWRKSAIYRIRELTPDIRRQADQNDTSHCRHFYLLCNRNRQHNISNAKYYFGGEIKSNKQTMAANRETFKLSCDSPACRHPISCVRHDPAYSPQRLLPFCSTSP